MKLHVCIHGHFYQPPRANPWTAILDDEPSAAPHPNWNTRITEECYLPNSRARILNASGAIVSETNNYGGISFDLGPTLATWLATHAPEVHAALLAADHANATRLGHGNAVAQSYHHTILPLADPHDRETEIRWGLDDFAHRFGRPAEGIWLPETAVCTATLEAAAAAGVKFTVLAPRQALAIRPYGKKRWRPVDEASLATHRAYRAPLPSGRSIALFFYNAPLSRAVAFEGLLHDGARFAHALTEAGAGHSGKGLVNIATDGESYGHHHRFGDMALAFCLKILRERSDVVLTNYGRYLAKHPPAWEARVREACERAADRKLSADEFGRLRSLLEMQRFALRMFSSCGWFFDDPSDIATIQDLRAAHRAIVATVDLGGPDLEAEFVERLAGLNSVNAGLDANGIWQELVVSARPAS